MPNYKHNAKLQILRILQINIRGIRFIRVFCIMFAMFALFALWASAAEAASFQLTPSIGTFNTGSRFNMTVSVDSKGIAINAAEGVINFDARYLIVENISTNISIFKFWVQEPTFSNAAGTISFSGGLPSPGYNGSNGKLLVVTFQATGAADLTLKFTSSAILANDGIGTNVLDSNQEARYKIRASVVTPQAEPLRKSTVPLITSEEDLDEVSTKINPPIITFYSKTFRPPKSVLMIEGTALPNVTVLGILRGASGFYTFETLSDSNGSWRTVFSERIPAGDYELTTQVRDQDNITSLETQPVTVKVTSRNIVLIISIIFIIGIIAVISYFAYSWIIGLRHRSLEEAEHFDKKIKRDFKKVKEDLRGIKRKKLSQDLEKLEEDIESESKHLRG